MSIVQKDNQLFYHITGTDFWDEIQHEELHKYSHVFSQSLVSENMDVYRGEYLAYSIFEAAKNKTLETLDALHTMSDAQLIEVVRTYMEKRYQEGYTKGVHDEDATKILRSLLELYHNVDLLIYRYQVRSMARLYWNRLFDETHRKRLKTRLEHLAKMTSYFTAEPKLDNYLPFVTEKFGQAYETFPMFEKQALPEAAEYLCKELMRGGHFVISLQAKRVYDGFMAYIRDKKALDTFTSSLESCKDDLEGQYFLVKEWVSVYWNDQLNDDEKRIVVDEDELSGVLDEVIVLLIEDEVNMNSVIQSATKTTIQGLVGSHTIIDNGTLKLDYTSFYSENESF